MRRDRKSHPGGKSLSGPGFQRTSGEQQRRRPTGERNVTARSTQRVEDQLTAIKAVSRTVSESNALEDTLATISRTAASLADAVAAAIILRRHESATGLAVAGSFGLSEQYASELNRIRPIEMGKGPSGLAAETGQPVTVTDVLTDPIFGPWRKLAIREHYRAMASVPLQLGNARRVIGVLNAYREPPGEWSDQEVDVLLTLADHAAIAIQTAQLLDESRRQVRGLSLVVRSLRTQGHEHSNVVHAIYGLLSIGEVGEALELISSVDARYQKTYARVADGIDNPVVSGFLVAETVIVGNGGIELSVSHGSRLRTLPPRLTDLDAITILGNLVENACEAVSGMPRRRRRISVRLSDRNGQLLFRIRDWGTGIPPEGVPHIFKPGYSTKSEHVGLGLGLVQSIVRQAGGEVEVEQARGPGVAITVRIPF